MPLTPYHFGPGMMLKGLLRRWFSLWIFILVQILTDFETLYFILKQEHPLHRFFHTYLGANVTMLLAVLLGRPAYHGWLSLRERIGKKEASSLHRLTWGTAFVSAALGSYSHVFLDSMMHSDLRPWNPFSLANPAYHFVSVRNLHFFCLVSGALGIVLCFVIGLRAFFSRSSRNPISRR